MFPLKSPHFSCSLRGELRVYFAYPDSSPLWALVGPAEGRGFSPAEIAAPTLYSSRTPRSLRVTTPAPMAPPLLNQEGSS
jgi:hypothetical protein